MANINIVRRKLTLVADFNTVLECLSLLHFSAYGGDRTESDGQVSQSQLWRCRHKIVALSGAPALGVDRHLDGAPGVVAHRIGRGVRHQVEVLHVICQPVIDHHHFAGSSGFEKKTTGLQSDFLQDGFLRLVPQSNGENRQVVRQCTVDYRPVIRGRSVITAVGVNNDGAAIVFDFDLFNGKHQSVIDGRVIAGIGRVDRRQHRLFVIGDRHNLVDHGTELDRADAIDRPQETDVLAIAGLGLFELLDHAATDVHHQHGAGRERSRAPDLGKQRGRRLIVQIRIRGKSRVVAMIFQNRLPEL